MLSMTNNDISSARDLTLEDDGIEVVESSTATTATVKQETTPAAEHQPSPTNSDSSGKPDTATQLLQYIGHYAGKKLRNSLARAPTGTHLKELTKLADYPYGEGTNMPRADAKTKAMAEYVSRVSCVSIHSLTFGLTSRIAHSQAITFDQTISDKSRKKRKF